MVLILDAYFAVAPVFALAASLWSMAHHVPWVTLIVRAKNRDYQDLSIHNLLIYKDISKT
jgi:hypothetical protein